MAHVNYSERRPYATVYALRYADQVERRIITLMKATTLADRLRACREAGGTLA